MMKPGGRSGYSYRNNERRLNRRGLFSATVMALTGIVIIP